MPITKATGDVFGFRLSFLYTGAGGDVALEMEVPGVGTWQAPATLPPATSPTPASITNSQVVPALSGLYGASLRLLNISFPGVADPIWVSAPQVDVWSFNPPPPHTDVPHSDALPYSFIPHGDYSDHSDAPHTDVPSYNYSPHSDSLAYGDVPHADWLDYSYSPHTDTAHGDSFYDDWPIYTVHSDAPYSYSPHSDYQDHADNPGYSDIGGHSDSPHTDWSDHLDSPHVDSLDYTFSPHTDYSAHSDVPHVDA